MIDEAEALLLRASERGAPGRYQLEAALQSAHVDRRRTGRSDWRAVVQIYDALLALSGSPVVAINRALALAQIDGARAGLAALDDVAGDARLEEYQPYWAARAELLANVGEHAEAHAAYDIAIGLERDPAVRKFLQERQASLRPVDAMTLGRALAARALGVSRGRRRTGMCAAEPQGWRLGVPREMPSARAANARPRSAMRERTSAATASRARTS